MERRDSAAAPSRATCRRATARISAVISPRTRSRAVRGADMALVWLFTDENTST